VHDLVRQAARRRSATIIFAALLSASSVPAQESVSVPLAGASGAAVLDVLAQECYQAGLAFEPQSDSIVDCSMVLAERVLAERDGEALDTIVVRHRLRFTLFERGGGEGHVAASAWTETEELGTTIEGPVVSVEYVERVRRVLAAAIASSNGAEAAPWLGRYESEQSWRLDAHLEAVRHCDSRLAGMTAEAVGEQLESIGLRPLHPGVRDRCEQLYTFLYEWGLARGDAEPTLEEYARYRASLPPARRHCSGELAPATACRR
jgi:hypothetical protein